jgi:hypothetical protein
MAQSDLFESSTERASSGATAPVALVYNGEALVPTARGSLPDLPTEVSLVSRAYFLIQALDSLGSANQAQGYLAAEHLPVQGGDIRNRYGTDGSMHQEMAARSRNDRGRHAFFAAHGVGYLAVATQDTPLTAAHRNLRRELNESWAEFRSPNRYGAKGNEGSQRRASYIKQLSHFLEV